MVNQLQFDEDDKGKSEKKLRYSDIPRAGRQYTQFAVSIMVEIFPWNLHLETGIALIDDQHRRLVGLLNRLAQQYVQGSSESEVHDILTELTDYADVHFCTEEGIWQSALAGDAWLANHIQSHQNFFTHVVALRSGSRLLQEVLDDLFSYLTQWLAYHILENDKRMAIAVRGIREGMEIEEARQQADEQMRGATAVLIQSVLAMYQTVCAQALELMHEKIARQSAEDALQNSKERWQFLLDGVGQDTHPEASLAQFLRTVIDNAPAGLIAADAATRRFVFANQWFCRMLGYGLDELLGMRPEDIHPSEVLPRVDAEFRRIQTGEKINTLAIPVRRKDGSLFMADIERVPVALSGQTSILAIFTDVTERHRAEQALKSSESHLRTLVNTIPDLIWLKDVRGVYQSCNPAFERFVGAAIVIGKTDYDLVPQALADSLREQDRAAMAAEHPMVSEEWVAHSSGQRVLLETTKVPMHDPNGQLLGVLGIAHNITGRWDAANALEAERLRLQNAIDAAQAGTWEWDIPSGSVRYNERSAAILGYAADGVQQRTYDQYLDLIHPEDLPHEQDLMTSLIRGELPRVEVEMRMRHQDGHWVWCRSLGRVMQRNALGDPELVAGISIDITEQKSHHAQIEFVTHHDALTGLPNRKMANLMPSNCCARPTKPCTWPNRLAKTATTSLIRSRTKAHANGSCALKKFVRPSAKMNLCFITTLGSCIFFFSSHD